jgi:transcriptional regulator with XRE-family HTH domain
MINANELKAYITRKGMTQAEVAKHLNMSPKTFYSHVQKGVFGSDDIEKMVVLLDIPDPVSVFFTSLVT